jgi:hypothetical protein
VIDDIKLDSLKLPVRVRSGLRYLGCETVGQARLLSDAQLLKMPNFSRGSLRRWKECLEELEPSTVSTVMVGFYCSMCGANNQRSVKTRDGRINVAKVVEEAGWISQQNGSHFDIYCSKRCAK